MEIQGTYELAALDYISKLADGGMRDAITMLDKCLSYSSELTLENVVKVLGTVEYDQMFALTDAVLFGEENKMFAIVGDIYASGKDLKLFIKTFSNFMLDVCKYDSLQDFKYLQIPALPNYETKLKEFTSANDYKGAVRCQNLLKTLIKLNADIKYETAPKALIESTLFLVCIGD